MKRHYEDHLRVRVCGILLQDEKILLVNHKGLTASGIFLSPPGGGVQFQEKMEETLKREFLEETGLHIQLKDFLFFDEYIKENIHAIEFFFKVEVISGALEIGNDPEETEQIIDNVDFYALNELQNLDDSSLHACLKNLATLDELTISGDSVYKR